jgi:hypothetical protein
LCAVLAEGGLIHLPVVRQGPFELTGEVVIVRKIAQYLLGPGMVVA